MRTRKKKLITLSARTMLESAEEFFAHIAAAAKEIRDTSGIYENIRSFMRRYVLLWIKGGVIISNFYFADNRCLFYFFLVFGCARDNKEGVLFVFCLSCVLYCHYRARKTFPTVGCYANLNPFDVPYSLP